MLLSLLLDNAGIKYDRNSFEDTEISNLSDNTESAGSGTLFVCICGARHDTHGDIPLLYEKGVRSFVVRSGSDTGQHAFGDACFFEADNTRKALALLAKSFYGSPDKRLITVGITGTKGKTTVSYMIREILRKHGHSCALIGTNGIIIGDSVTETANSTPGSILYYSALKRAADEKAEYAVIEVTSQSLMQHRTFGTVFDLAIFTNLSPDHIGENEHKSFSEYRECKGKLFASCKNALLNKNSGHFGYFENICRQNGINVRTFGLGEEMKSPADFTALEKESDMNGSTISMNGTDFRIGLPGSFNTENAVCALSACCTLGIDVFRAPDALSDVCVPGRSETVQNDFGVCVIIDYAHTGESLRFLLTGMKMQCRGRLFCVFGCGGNRSKLRRYGMGKAAGELADLSIITNDNPRHESPESIVSDILEGMNASGGAYKVILDRKEAILFALSEAKKEDTVVLAGKGSQLYGEYGDKRFYFNEREIVREFFERKRMQNSMDKGT